MRLIGASGEFQIGKGRFGMKRSLITLTLAFAVLAARPALASPLDITNIIGQWQNAVGGPLTLSNNQSGQLTDQIRWGEDLSGLPFGSGYDFTPGADLLGVAVGVPFVLGTFTHHNQPIALGTEITAVEYALQIATNGLPGTLGTVLSFSHNETPNTPPPTCPAGTIGPYCADVVTIGVGSLSGPVTVGSERYTFTLLGFSPDGVAFNSTYLSQENGSNTTQLFAVVRSEPVPAPEPASLLLFGSGLAGAAAMVRRARRKRQERAAAISAISLAPPTQD
ncbi:MAG TPA: THxN family PEP-CTERM protein [Vicinamibacterales bacterium]